MSTSASAAPDTSNLLAALKAKLESASPALYSDAPGQFPLRCFLLLVNKANYECYINYMEGAEILYQWLTSDGKYQLSSSFSAEELEQLDKPNSLLGSYQLNELTKIMTGKKSTFFDYLSESARIHKLVLYELLAMATTSVGVKQS